jgi:hypothetical protein
MHTFWQNIAHGLQSLVRKPAFAAVFATLVVGISTHAALCCLVSSYASEKVASGMVAALTLVRILSSIWFLWLGIRTIG